MMTMTWPELIVLLLIAGHTEFECVGFRIFQDNVTALCTGERDHRVGNLIQHHVQVQRRIDQFGSAGQFA